MNYKLSKGDIIKVVKFWFPKEFGFGMGKINTGDEFVVETNGGNIIWTTSGYAVPPDAIELVSKKTYAAEDVENLKKEIAQLEKANKEHEAENDLQRSIVQNMIAANDYHKKEIASLKKSLHWYKSRYRGQP